MANALAAYAHYLSIFVLFALLTLEHRLFAREITVETARSLIRLDIAYGVCAGLVLVTGLARVLWFGKGLAYYLGNGLFHAKVGLFILVGLISVVPTWVYLSWRNDLKAGRMPNISAGQARLVTTVIRLELALLLVIPLLATMMARGIGTA